MGLAEVFSSAHSFDGDRLRCIGYLLARLSTRLQIAAGEVHVLVGFKFVEAARRPRSPAGALRVFLECGGSAAAFRVLPGGASDL